MNNVAQSLLDLPRTGKRVLVMATDILLCLCTVWLSMSLRFEQWAALDTPLMIASSVAALLALPLFVMMGLYRAIFRYSGLPALMTVISAVSVYALAYITIFGLVGVQGVPRSVGFLQPLLLLVAVGGSRMLAWIWLGGHYQRLIQRCDIPRVLVFGAGSAGRQLVGAIHNSPEPCMSDSPFARITRKTGATDVKVFTYNLGCDSKPGSALLDTLTQILPIPAR